MQAPSHVRQLALFGLAALLAGFTLLRGYDPHDDGLMLQAGARIASGQLPYRDFWMNYPPGQAVVLALLDKLFGASLLSWRILRVAVDATAALLAYRLARTLTSSERLALLVCVAVAGAMAWPAVPGPNPTALMLALAALVAAPRRPLLAGALAGLAVFFRLEIGAAAALGVVMCVPAQARIRAALMATAAAAVTLVPFFAADPSAMWHDTIGFLGIQHLQHLPFPIRYHGSFAPRALLDFYFPLILLLSAGLWVLAALAEAVRTRKTTRRNGLIMAPLALVSVGYLLGRTDEYHLLPLSAVLAVMLACAAAVERRAALRVALIGALALIALYGLQQRGWEALHPPAEAAVPGPAGGGVQTSPADARALGQLLATVNRLTAPGEPIFVANPRFDLVRIGDPLLYIILGHPNPTRYDVIQPGVVTTAPVQREIVSSLQRSHTRVVVRWLDPAASQPEPNGAGRSSGVHILDRYLAANFQPYATYGYYEVLTRWT
ncbi:MAG TPA: hypothetical protein VK790_08765 [Solirubrobacteraceae bacterium]|jgi:hypothetical protein|nr:hypothetical protein [Solirubrobacteraceae bacterium]